MNTNNLDRVAKNQEDIPNLSNSTKAFSKAICVQYGLEKNHLVRTRPIHHYEYKQGQVVRRMIVL